MSNRKKSKSQSANESTARAPQAGDHPARTWRRLVCGLVLATFVPESESGPIRLTDVTNSVGITFTHEPRESGNYLLPEITGSGAAFLDYDGDGDLDIYLVQAGQPADPIAPRPNAEPNRLFRQESDGRFVDVTDASGLGDRGYGMGVAVGDIDNDGLVDVFVTNYGPDRLYRNEGDGRFRDVTANYGITGSAWSASAVFCDYDADGFLDLYVTQYVSHDPEKRCTHSDGSVDYCSPQVFPGTPDLLFKNESGRRFVDVSARSGIRAARSPGLGVLCADLDDDGALDFYVTNDGEANQLWLNAGDGTFSDDAFLSGVALNDAGQPEAGMGITAGDVDLDGDLDLFMTHVVNQTNTLYLSGGDLGYEDRSTAFGLGATSLALTGFGTGFADLDLDGDLDLAIVNGRVQRQEPLLGAEISPYWNAYAEPDQVLANRGDGRFDDVSVQAGDFGSELTIARGLAFGDYDEDGDLDLLVSNAAGSARLYRNDSEPMGNYLVVRVREPSLSRDAHGAHVAVVAGGRRYVRLATPAYSYLASNDPRAHFGVPRGVTIERIEVRWPGGATEIFDGVEPSRAIVLERGGGR